MKATPTPKTRRCKVCRCEFVPFRMGCVCSADCAKALVDRKKAKEAARQEREVRRVTREMRESLKPLSHFVKEAQAAFNAFIRARDRDEPCISCGRCHGGKWNAGHFFSTGARPELRFEELNVHKQCEPCNTYLSGNLLHYRRRLIAKIGREKLAWLEGPHPASKWTREELKAIKARYRAKAKELTI